MKRVIKITLSLIVSMTILYIYCSLFGIPFYKNYTSKVLNNYIEQKYKNEKLKVNNIEFNFKNNCFQAEVISLKDNSVYYFSHYYNNTIYDPIYSKLINNILTDEIKSFVNKENEKIKIPTGVFSVIKVNQDYTQEKLKGADIISISLTSNENYNSQLLNDYTTIVYKAIIFMKSNYNLTKVDAFIDFSNKIVSMLIDKDEIDYNIEELIKLSRIVDRVNS